MATEPTCEELLEQLKKETGLDLSLTPASDPMRDRTALLQLIKTLRSASGRSSFLRDLLLGQIDEADIHMAPHRLPMDEGLSGALLLLFFEKPHSSMEVSILSNIYNAAVCDVVPMDEHNIVLIRTLESQEAEILSSMAEEVLAIIQTEALQNVCIAYDTVSPEPEALPGAYRNASLAMKIGRTFYADRNIYAFRELGLGSLLYQLPRDACISYLERSLPGVDLRTLDAETLNMIRTFFACDLNIAESARSLYMHRNTLVYRLDTLKKQTGLDIRKFDDAIRCQIALLLWEML